MTPGRRGSARMVAAIIAATVTLTGCSGSNGGFPITSPTPSITPTAARVPNPSVTMAQRSDFTVADSIIPTRDAEVSWLHTWGHYATWAGARAREQPTDHVTLHDINTGQQRQVAKAPQGGRVGWPRGDGERLVYTSTVDRPATARGDEQFDWQIRMVDLAKDASTVLARPKTVANRTSEPTATISYPWVVWQTVVAFDELNYYDVTALNLRTGQRRTLIKRRTVTDVQVMGDQVYYVDMVGERTDAHVMPVTGGQARQLTTSGAVGRITATRHGVAYHEPAIGDPASLWVLPRGTTISRELAGRAFFMQMGAGFVAWRELNKVFVRSTGLQPAPSLEVGRHSHGSSRLAVHEDRVVFVESLLDADGRPVGHKMHLVRVNLR